MVPRSCLELFGVPRSNSAVARCTATGTYSYLLRATQSWSELFGVARGKGASVTNPTRNVLKGDVYKVKTSKLGDTVKPGQCLEKLLCTILRILITPSPE